MKKLITNKVLKSFPRQSKWLTTSSLQQTTSPEGWERRSEVMKQSKVHTAIQAIIISVMVVSFFAIPSSAQVWLEADNGDAIYCGQPVTWSIYLANNSGEAVTGFQHGFKIYSPNGAEWQPPTWTWPDTLEDIFDFVSAGGFSVDGTGADTIFCSGISGMQPGVPNGYDDVILRIETMVDASYQGDTLCIDSTFYQPNGAWLWSNDAGDFVPDWAGPYCFELMLIPDYGSISGTKFHDENGNSVWEPGLGESGLDHWEIHLEGTDDLGPVSRTEWTNSQGEYTFASVRPGNYRVLEVMDPSWMAQTYPTTVFHTIDNFQWGDDLINVDFGNDSVCEQSYSYAICEAGTKDDFTTPEPAHWSPAMTTYLQGIGTYITNFDEPAVNQRFGHTIENCWDDNCVVMAATLCLRLKATGAIPTTDGLVLGDYSQDGRIWSASMNTLISEATGGADQTWDVNDEMIICLNLADLSNVTTSSSQPTNILAALQDGDLDIYIQDDTEVDWIELSVELCCSDTCYADGDIDLDGIALTTADYIYLSKILAGQATPPAILYPGNFNNDGYLNSFDLDIFDDYRATGIGAFTPYGGYPVPLDDCYPVLEICTGDRGNVNGDDDDILDISDLTYLVDYLFGGGEAPPSTKEADVNGDGTLDISDLTYLVEYFFAGGEPPVPCSTPPPVGSAKLNDPVKLNSTYDGESTRLSVSTLIEIRGVQLELRSSGDLTIDNLAANGIELLQYEQNGIYRIGLLDMNGAAVIGSGDLKLLEIRGQFEVVSALVADINHNTIAAALLSGGNGKNLPDAFSLGQNYPNPFNPATEIEFSLPRSANIRMEIYNIAGQKVATLVDGQRDAGQHSVFWDASENASGVYFYRLSADDFVDTRKMLLLK